MISDLAKLFDEVGMKPVFGLKGQGHIPTIEKMLAQGASWEEIGKAIGWHGPTAQKHWGWYQEDQQSEPR